MSPPDSSDIDAALVALLQADPTLAAMTATPGGFVFVDEAPAGLQQFVIVSLVNAHDEPMFSARAFEDGLFLVKFVELSTVATPAAKAAAARIDALLDQGTLTVPGYSLMIMRRESRVRKTEVDDVDPTIRWYHRGGNYRVVVSPT